MPEGPEVYTQCQQLNAVLAGKLISEAWNYDRYYENLWTKCSLTGCTVVQVVSHGKNLLFWFRAANENLFLVVQHLMMSGSWRLGEIEGNGTPRGRWIAEGVELVFYDPRRLSTYKYFPTVEEGNEFISSLGKDWMRLAFQWEASLTQPEKRAAHILEQNQFVAEADRSRSKICTFIMPSRQKPYAGIGNYLKSEIMFVMGLSPEVKVKQLDRVTKLKLYDIICCILVSSAYAQGVSVRDYAGITGCGGTFERWVYRQTEEPFWKQPITTTQINGRGTYWVPAIQTLSPNPEVTSFLEQACWNRYLRSKGVQI